MGKGTVVKRLRALHPELFVSRSVTTRKPRVGERDGVDYHFITDAEFDRLVETGGLLEWAVVHRSARYGTPRQAVLDAVARGQRVVLEIDLQGARQVRRTFPDAVHIFLGPPSWEELIRRLRGRGTETEDQISQRLTTAREELANESEFDYVVVNGEVDETVAELVSLIGLGETLASTVEGDTSAPSTFRESEAQL